jgi:hypothetical protein
VYTQKKEVKKTTKNKISNINVSIQEISNGFTVEEFSMHGSPELDRTVYVNTFEEALREIKTWYRLELSGDDSETPDSAEPKS